MRLLKISEYAKIKGQSYATIYRWIKNGILQHETELTPTNRIMIKVPDTPTADIINGVADAMDKETKR